MTEHVIYAKPVTVTQERLEAAMTKQAKQKAFKEALDRQIEETGRLRPFGGPGEARAMNGQRRGRSQPVNAGAGRQRTIDAGDDGKGQDMAYGEPDKVMAESSALPVTGNGDTATADASHPPAMPETTRYSFTFEEGLGHFVEKTVTPSLPHVTPSPSTPTRSQGTTTVSKPTPPVSDGAGGYGYKKKAQQSKGTIPRKVLAGVEGKDCTAMMAMLTFGASGGAGSSSVKYQTNSLPIDLVRQGGSPGQKTAIGMSSPRGASRTPGRRRSPQASPHEKGGGGAEPAYDTQSLPVNLIYRLEAGASGVGGSPQNGASTSHATGALPSAHRVPRGAGNVNVSSTGRQPSPRHVSHVVLPPLHPIACESTARPLSPDTGGRGGAPDDVIELSQIIEDDVGEGNNRGGAETRPGRHTRAPVGEGKPGRPSSRSPLAGGVELERLQRELHSREAMVRKMREKERSWEEQVKQLKIELRNARRKERDLSRQRGTGGGPPVAGLVRAPPRRAETAPDPPYPSESEGSPGGVLSALREGRMHGPELARGGAGPPLLPRDHGRGRPDFTKACIFTPNSFRPITAPDFPDTAASSNVYFPSAPPPLAARGPGVHDGRRHRGADTVKDGDAKNVGDGCGNEADEEDRDAVAHIVDVPPPPLDNSFKLASWTTQQTTLGLPREAALCPVPIEHAHLLQFAEAQIITQQQADRLWDFFVELKGTNARTGDSATGTDVVDYVELSDKLEVASSRSPGRTADDDKDETAPSSTPRRQRLTPPVAFPREDYHQPRGNGGVAGNTPVLTAALRDKINRRFQTNEAYPGDAAAHRGVLTGNDSKRPSPGATPERATSPPHRTPPTETLSPAPSSRHTSEGRSRERKAGVEVRGGHVSRSTSAQLSPSEEQSSRYTTPDDVQEPPLSTTTINSVSARNTS